MNFFRRLLASNDKPAAADKSQVVAPPPPSPVTVSEAGVNTAELNPATLPPAPSINYGDGATRPLNEEVLATFLTPRHLTFGQITDTGMVRNNNQDSVFSFFATSRSVDEQPDVGIFVVGDGMGGHHDGEKASATAVRTVAQHLISSVYLPMISNQNDALMPINEALVTAIEAANSAVNTHLPESGTTLTAMILIKDLAYVAHVGDSRLYIVNKGGIERVTRDHSMVQRLLETDQITAEEALDHPSKHILYRAVGQSEHIEVDVLTRRIPNQARLLLCSDGLWGMVEEKDLIEIISHATQPQDACQKLVALANKRGGMDNITAILIFLPE
jgi:protein phosphatase